MLRIITMYLFFEEKFPMIRRNAKNTTPAPRGTIMNVRNPEGALRTKNSEIAPRNATVITSKTRSTTREDTPSEYVVLYSCLSMKTRTKSPSLAGTTRLTVWLTKMQAVETFTLTE